MSNATLEANLYYWAMDQAASSGEETQKWSSNTSWDMFQLYNEIMYCESTEDQVRVTSLLAFATKKGWTKNPPTT